MPSDLVTASDDKDGDAKDSMEKHAGKAYTRPVSHDRVCLNIEEEGTAVCYEKLLLDVRNGRVVPLEFYDMHKITSLDTSNAARNTKKVKGCSKISWPSGSSYEGETMNGVLHGVGTYKSTDGNVYKGQWALNKKHGFGRKCYANGDVYEGTWKLNVPEGKGKYTWNDGSEYSGDWKNGMMSGSGILTWPNGDDYDGEWCQGVADGDGVYTFADGSAVIGTWRNGLLHGERVHYPPQYKYVEEYSKQQDGYRSDDVDDGVKITVESPRRQKISSPSHLPKEFRRLKELRKLRQASMLQEPKPENLTSVLHVNKEQKGFLERFWNVENSRDCLAKSPNPIVSEDDKESLSHGDDSSVFETDDSQTLTMKQRKEPSGTIYKRHQSYDLMLSLQLGIRYSVGRITPQPTRKHFRGEFGAKSAIKMSFPKEGSQMTPPHNSVDFTWKDYCPLVFRKLREIFKIDAAEYMLSICGNDGLRERPSTGKSGSSFYLSHDECYMVKTLRKTEVKALLRILPKYFSHVQKYENTLLTRFLGLYRVKPIGGQKVRFVVMGNVTSTDSWIHRRYDLKGSSHGRSTGKVGADMSITFKDLDLDYVFQLERQHRDVVLSQISEDCKFLESEHIMDYSLLLGLHFNEPSTIFAQKWESKIDFPLHETVISRFVECNGEFLEIGMELKCSPPRNLEYQPATDLLEDLKNVKLDQHGKGETNRMLHPEERLKVQIGTNMPAKAFRKHINGGKDPYDPNDAYNVTLYFGIIDILQEYNMGKKIEHAYKSIQFDPYSISAVDPVLYSRRFQHFMHEIFCSAEAE